MLCSRRRCLLRAMADERQAKAPLILIALSSCVNMKHETIERYMDVLPPLQRHMRMARERREGSQLLCRWRLCRVNMSWCSAPWLPSIPSANIQAERQ